MTKRKNNLSLEKMLALPFQRMAKLSPDGRKITFVSNMSGQGELHVLDIKTRMIDQVTHGEYGLAFVFDHYWSPDSTSMIFPRDPTSGKEKWNLYRISIPDGKVTQITDSPENSDVDGKQSPIDESVAFISDRSGSYQMHLAKLDGSYIGQFTEDVGNVIPVLSDWYWSPDGQFTVFSRLAPENPQQYDIWMARVDGSDEKRLISVASGSQEVVNHISKDGSMVLITSDYSGTHRAGIYHLEEDEIKWIGDGTSEEEGVCFAADDSSVIIVRHADAESKLVVFDIASGESTLLRLPPGISSAGKDPIDGRLLLVSHEDSTHRHHYLLYDLENHTSDEILEAHYGDFTPDSFHPEEYVSYPSSGGVTIHALLYRPKDILPEERLPALIVPHGGPTLHYIRGFREPVQVLVDLGYVCLLPNVRGSTGYGAEFRDACLKDWGGKDLDDIEHAVTYLKQLDFVDGDRVGIYGASYGGYLAYMALTKKPQLWKAGAAVSGITDLKILYDESETLFPPLRLFMQGLMGNPEDEESLWKDRSAVNFADRITAKLLMIHAANDPRCGITQAEIFREKLLEHGYKEGEDFEYRILEDRGHFSDSTKQKIEYYQYLIDFLERYL